MLFKYNIANVISTKIVRDFHTHRKWQSRSWPGRGSKTYYAYTPAISAVEGPLFYDEMSPLSIANKCDTLCNFYHHFFVFVVSFCFPLVEFMNE